MQHIAIADILLYREDIQTLKRLQRDAFEQMLRLDQRLDTLEERTNLSGDSSSGASALFGGVQGSSRAAAAADRAPVQASGQLIYGIGRPVPVRPCPYSPDVPFYPYSNWLLCCGASRISRVARLNCIQVNTYRGTCCLCKSMFKSQALGRQAHPGCVELLAMSVKAP